MTDITSPTDLVHKDSKLAAAIVRALAHPLRLRILTFIHLSKNTHVNAIYGTLSLEQSITSQHLKVLRNAGIVNSKRDGKFIYYSVNYPKLASIVKNLGEVFG